MAKQRSNTPSRNDAKVAYEPSNEVRSIAKMHSVMSHRFSIALIEAKMSKMDSMTRLRALRVIACLQSRKFYRF